MEQYLIYSFVQINIKIEIVTIELNITIRSYGTFYENNFNYFLETTCSYGTFLIDFKSNGFKMIATLKQAQRINQ